MYCKSFESEIIRIINDTKAYKSIFVSIFVVVIDEVLVALIVLELFWIFKEKY